MKKHYLEPLSSYLLIFRRDGFFVNVVFPAIMVLFACVGQSIAAPVLSADFIYTNSKVYTVNKKQPWAEAVAVVGNKIVFVGSNAEVEKYVGEKSKVISLKGMTMLPGFVEGHIHVVAGGVLANGLDLQADDKEEIFCAYSRVCGKHQ